MTSAKDIAKAQTRIKESAKDDRRVKRNAQMRIDVDRGEKKPLITKPEITKPEDKSSSRSAIFDIARTLAIFLFLGMYFLTRSSSSDATVGTAEFAESGDCCHCCPSHQSFLTEKA